MIEIYLWTWTISYSGWFGIFVVKWGLQRSEKPEACIFTVSKRVGEDCGGSCYKCCNALIWVCETMPCWAIPGLWVLWRNLCPPPSFETMVGMLRPTLMDTASTWASGSGTRLMYTLSLLLRWRRDQDVDCPIGPLRDGGTILYLLPRKTIC